MTVYERAACREGEITKAIYVIRPCTHGLLNKCVLYERCSRVEKKTSACTAHVACTWYFNNSKCDDCLTPSPPSHIVVSRLGRRRNRQARFDQQSVRDDTAKGTARGDPHVAHAHEGEERVDLVKARL